jgi:hypothetical protein
MMVLGGVKPLLLLDELAELDTVTPLLLVVVLEVVVFELDPAPPPVPPPPLELALLDELVVLVGDGWPLDELPVAPPTPGLWLPLAHVSPDAATHAAKAQKRSVEQRDRVTFARTAILVERIPRVSPASSPFVKGISASPGGNRRWRLFDRPVGTRGKRRRRGRAHRLFE